MSQRSKARKRWNYEQQAVLAYAYPDETYAAAKKRLDELWRKGEHPSQIARWKNQYD